MRFIHATYNMFHNSIDITTFDGYILRIDCEKAEEGLKTLEYATLYLESGMQTWVDAEDSLEPW